MGQRRQNNGQVSNHFGASLGLFKMKSSEMILTQAHWQMANRQTPLPLYVPEDCNTLEEAVKRVAQDPRITTIVLGKGDHQINGHYLEISSATRIVGRPGVPKEKIVVVGGIRFKKGIQGNCHLQHLAALHAMPFDFVSTQLIPNHINIVVPNGVFGWMAHIRMEIYTC